ncbi:hypothetical protein ACFWXO_30905 [Kitasatospora sp. NPDC059088]
MNLLALRSLVFQGLENQAGRPDGEVTGVEMSNPPGSHGPCNFRLAFTEI